MFDFNPYKVKINLSKNHIFQMVNISVIFELYVQALFNSNLKLDRGRGWQILRLIRILDQKELLMLNLPIISLNSNSNEVF